MKVVIAGSRSIIDYDAVCLAIEQSGFTITEVVSGTARGVDRLGERWAQLHKVPIKRFPADWDRDGRAAGPIRNGRMSEYGEALILVWDGRSPGSRSMLETARRRGMEVYEVIL